MQLIDTRPIDCLGRVILPFELRYLLKVKEGDSLDAYYVDSNTAILQVKRDMEQNQPAPDSAQDVYGG